MKMVQITITLVSGQAYIESEALDGSLSPLQIYDLEDSDQFMPFNTYILVLLLLSIKLHYIT